jgi:hypothetical protein
LRVRGRLTSQVGLGEDDRQGRPQLVGDLVCEPPLGGERVDDPVQQLVEGAPEVGDLVATLARVEAAPHVVLAPVVGEVGHGLHLAQRSRRGHPRGTSGDQHGCRT